MIRNFEIAFVLILFALAVFVIFPLTTKFTNCFAISTGRIQQAQVPPQVSKETFCKDGQEIFMSLNSCVSEVKSNNMFAPLFFRLVVLLPQTKNIPSTIDKHNQVCPNYPVEQLF